MTLDSCIFASAQPPAEEFWRGLQSKTAGQPARGVQREPASFPRSFLVRSLRVVPAPFNLVNNGEETIERRS